jgi:hypothetical protein
MAASVANNVVAYRRKQQKVEVWIIRLITEAWELLLLSASQVALNLFNGKLCRYEFYVILLHNC